MRRIVLDMQYVMFAEAISQTLEKNEPDFAVCFAETPAETAALCRSSRAWALIMEVTASRPRRLEERIRIRDDVKAFLPDCRIALLVDENADRELAAAVRQAKKDGLIDNFIYGSVSPAYLMAVIDTL